MKIELYRGPLGTATHAATAIFSRFSSENMKEKLLTCSKMANASIHAEDDLLDTSFEMTDKGVVLAAKIKIAFSLIAGSGDNINEFMKRVDDDVSHMNSLSSLSTLGQVLKSTKAIMDQVSQVVHLSSLNLIIVG